MQWIEGIQDFQFHILIVHYLGLYNCTFFTLFVNSFVEMLHSKTDIKQKFECIPFNEIGIFVFTVLLL